MDLTNKHIFYPIENKTVVWFAYSNEYIIFENEVAFILQQLFSGISIDEIALSKSIQMEIPFGEIKKFVEELNTKFILNPNTDKFKQNKSIVVPKKPITYEISETYLINDISIKVAFLSSKERELIHPKFQHLVVSNSTSFSHYFEVFYSNDEIYLYVNKQHIGSWNSKNIHYFQGKFSMELIQKIHQKEESSWLGVFHASAVSDKKNSILFLGDSGNGKSTSLALLQANGLNCLADDFVPILAENKEVYSFPAAISIKKNSIPALTSLYPKLATTTEYHLERMNKIVRYLPPNNSDFKAHAPCKKIVFIKYEKDSIFQINSISKLTAFQQLIPDSWISPLPENASIFLDWFNNLKCYQIKYSDNEKMIYEVKKLFNTNFYPPNPLTH